MARNGSGTYSLPTPENPVVTNTVISSTDFNTTMNDLEASMTQSLSKDGQTVITGDMDFNGNGITDVDVILLQDDIQHSGDINNKIAFTTDTQTYQTGGLTRMDLTDLGMQLGAANARITTVLDEDTMVSDSATSLSTQQSIKAYTDSAKNILIPETVTHDGDLDNTINFGTDTQDYKTGGSSRIDFSDTGVRMGGANTRVTTILDEDDMTSDSATALASQQSIKAYTDTREATKAQMEAATATTVYPSPATTVNHPGVCKAWISFNGSGTIAIRASYNISALEDDGTGLYNIFFDVDFSSIEYCAVCMVDDTGGSALGHGGTTPAVGSFQIQTVNLSGTAVDAEFVWVAFFGDQ